MDGWASPWKAAGSLWKELETSLDKAMGVEELEAQKRSEAAAAATAAATADADDEVVASPVEEEAALPRYAAPAPATPPVHHKEAPKSAPKSGEESFFGTWGLANVAQSIKTMVPTEIIPTLEAVIKLEPLPDPAEGTSNGEVSSPPTRQAEIVSPATEEAMPDSLPSEHTFDAAGSALSSRTSSPQPVVPSVEQVEAPLPAHQPVLEREITALPSDTSAPEVANPIEYHAVEAEVHHLPLAVAASTDGAASDRERKLQEQLNGREKQVESLSLQAAKALDDVVRLQSALEAAESRAGKLEKALQAEKSRAAKASKESAGSSKLQDRIAELEAEMQHRDNKITEIMGEGETLSKRVGSLENTIKHLRSSLRAVEAERDAKKEEIASIEARLASMKSRMTDLEAEASFARKDKDTASDVANASQNRLAAAEEEVNKLRLETKAMRASLAAAQREAEESRDLVVKALADAESAEKSQREMENAIASARAAEGTASRIVAVYEDQIRDLRSQIQNAQETLGQREDDFRREVSDLQMRLQRVQSNAEDTNYSALAAAYGVSLSSKEAFVSSPGDRRMPSSPGSANVVESLLGQVAALQAELQSKRDAWAASRATLQARIAAAESALEAADQDVKRAEASASDSAQTAASLRTEIMAMRSVKARTDADLSLTNDKLRDTESKLLSLTTAHEALQRQYQEANSSLSALRARLEEQTGSKAAASHMATVLKEQLVAAQAEILAYKRELSSMQRDKRPYGEGAQPLSSPDLATSGFLNAALSNSLLEATGSGTIVGTHATLLQALENERTMLTDKVMSLTVQLERLQGR
jgi:predicted  nucleic acid-binding Zn-ribbon protein